MAARKGSAVTADVGQRKPHTRWGFAAVFGIVGSLIIGVLVLGFIWPSLTAQPQHIPVAVAGSDATVAQLETTLDQKSAELFTFSRVPDRATALARIQDRSADGAFVLGAETTVLTSSAASTATAQTLTSIASELRFSLAAQASEAGRPTPTLTVTDAVPLSSTDPRGIALTAMAFPLVLGGILGGVLITFLVVGIWRRVLALVVYTVAAGAIVDVIMQPWFGGVQGNVALNMAAIGLAIGATGSIIVGFHALLGSKGIAVGAIVTMLIGNPLSASTMPVQFLAEPWGSIGQWFVPGASITLLRGISYFPQADPTLQWLILVGWFVLGLLAVTLGHFRNRGPIVLPPSELDGDESTRARTHGAHGAHGPQGAHRRERGHGTHAARTHAKA